MNISQQVVCHLWNTLFVTLFIGIEYVVANEPNLMGSHIAELCTLFAVFMRKFANLVCNSLSRKRFS